MKQRKFGGYVYSNSGEYQFVIIELKGDKIETHNCIKSFEDFIRIRIDSKWKISLEDKHRLVFQGFVEIRVGNIKLCIIRPSDLDIIANQGNLNYLLKEYFGSNNSDWLIRINKN